MRSVAGLIIVALWTSGGSNAQVYMTREEALEHAFPEGMRIERKTLFLTDQQVAQVQRLARSRVESKVITYYAGTSDSGTVGYAFFETHIVRTMPETFMAVINTDGSVKMVEILAFYEPEDYKPSNRWLQQFQHQTLSDDMWLKRGIRGISGATMTAQAITEGVRRLLAIHAVALR